MTDTITLTREQWNTIWDGLDQIRDSRDCDGISSIIVALRTFGLHAPADAIDEVFESIWHQTVRLQDLLMQADEAMPAPAKPRAMPKWFWPINKSNREA